MLLRSFSAATADVALGGQKLIGVAEPALAQDAATKKYVDDANAAINTLADGKIYVVVGVVLIILLGLFAYLFYIDKKLSRIEKNQQ